MRSNLFQTHVFLKFVFGATSNHTPHKNRRMMKTSNQSRHIYIIRILIFPASPSHMIWNTQLGWVYIRFGSNKLQHIPILAYPLTHFIFILNIGFMSWEDYSRGLAPIRVTKRMCLIKALHFWKSGTWTLMHVHWVLNYTLDQKDCSISFY